MKTHKATVKFSKLKCRVADTLLRTLKSLKKASSIFYVSRIIFFFEKMGPQQLIKGLYSFQNQRHDLERMSHCCHKNQLKFEFRSKVNNL